ncbi:MAG TPA: efflux RND transporter periplasmic adaptor subunit [Candidatus Bilophila faecipullorum]|uniref:Efflux RND transporter periplasmic adaptor subunit n=1 Tax=Candidatus Bilophila faecipullorum TaxID=2838482 RepID=A0A9D1R1J6_9BACT|nr:efflux RND transporter periplasmic adaptor subunit [Candidatus Bilophila faecipullorum]
MLKHERLPFRFGVTLFACLIGSLPLMGCKDENTAAGPSAAPAVEVAVDVVTPQKVLYTTELAGRTSAFQIAEVRPQVSGIIQKRLFTEGADVKAGDTLYQIDPATYKADLDSAKANLARAEANVAPARLKMQRFKDLVNISAVSKQEYEDAEAAYKQALADVGVNKAAVENARIRLDYTKVTSPISGRTGRSLVTPGALVTANQGNPLTTVQQLDPVYVDVTQSSTEVLRLKRALESGTLQRADEGHAAVRLLLEDGSEYAHSGTLQFTDVSVDESTGMVTLRAIFPNPEHDLMPGMYVRAILKEGVDEQAILLPQRALVRDAKGNATAYVVNAESKVEVRPLKVGRTQGNSWVVLDGLKAGDKVIVEGIQKIRPGATVRIAATPDAQAAPAPEKR